MSIQSYYGLWGLDVLYMNFFIATIKIGHRFLVDIVVKLNISKKFFKIINFFMDKYIFIFKLFFLKTLK